MQMFDCKQKAAHAKKKLRLQLFEKLQVQFSETHKKPTGILIFSFGRQKVAGAIFPTSQVQLFLACAAFFVVSGYSKCSDWSLMLECAVVIYNRKLDVVWFTSLIHIFRKGSKTAKPFFASPFGSYPPSACFRAWWCGSWVFRA